MLFGETLFCCFFSIQLFGRFFWLLFSSIGNKLQIIVGFGASLTKKKKKKSELDKTPINRSGKSLTDFEKDLLVSENIQEMFYFMMLSEFRKW